MPPDHRPQQPLGYIAHLVLFVACVVFPAALTMIAPVCTVDLERQGEQVTASVAWNCFFVIPFHRRVIADVTTVDDHVIAGELAQQTSRGIGDSVSEFTTESQGFFVIHGKTGEIKVPVSPENLSDTRQKASEFLKTKNGAPSLHFRTVANWKFGVVAGGILTLFTVVYLWTAIAWCFRRGKPQPQQKPWQQKP